MSDNNTFSTRDLKLAALLKYNRVTLLDYAEVGGLVEFIFAGLEECRTIQKAWQLESPLVDLKKYLSCWDELWKIVREKKRQIRA